MRRLLDWWPFALAGVGGYILLPNPNAPPLPAGGRALGVACCLLAVFGLLAWSSGLLQRGVTLAASLFTRDWGRAQGVYFSLMRPGVLLHEFAHVLAVWLVRGQVTGFSAGETVQSRRSVPQKGGGGTPVRLGHVRYKVWGRSRFGLRLRDAFIGFAPLPVGVAVIAGVLVLLRVDPGAGLPGITGRDWGDWRLWAGALVVLWVANQMTPSDVDRKNWPLALLLLAGYVLIGVGALWLANQQLGFVPPGAWLAALTDGAAILAAVLAVPVVLNVLVGVGLIGVYRLVRGR